MTPVFVVTIGDAIGLAALALLAIIVLLFFLRQWLGQIMCKHNGAVGETSACDAICHKCGKNLGFIGAWRDQHRKDNT
jgi:hypothetical protein